MNKHALLRLGALPGAILLAAWLAGCASLESIREFSDPRVGFLVSSITQNEAARASYATRLADVELTRLRQPLADTIPGLATYEQALSQAFKVSPGIEGCTDLSAMSDGEKQRLTRYFDANPSRLAINGSAASPEWAAELEKVRQALAGLNTQKTRLLAEVEQAAYRKAFESVPALCDRVERLDPVDTTLRQRLDSCRSAALNGTLQSVPLELDRIQKEFFDAAKPPARVELCLPALDRADLRLADIRAMVSTRERLLQANRGAMAALEKVEKQAATLRGRTWAAALGRMAAALQYWEAHTFAKDRGGELPRFTKSSAESLRRDLLEAYARLLPKAMAFYVGKANDRLAGDAYGVALTFCRMSQDMAAFAQGMGLSLPAEAATWETRTQDSIQDCQKRLKAIMSRRIVINDLIPQADEGGRLAGLVYESCARFCSAQPASDKASTPPPTVWAVQAERRVKDPGDSDYIFDGTISRLSINPRPPQEISRSIIKVGGDSHEIPNPLYTPKSDLPPTAFSQEVLVYQKTDIRHVKEVQLAMTLTCKYQGNTLEFLSLSRQWPNTSSPLPGVQIIGTETRLDSPFLGAPRIGASQIELAKDPLPRASAPEISPDQQIKDFVLLHARDEIARSIETLVGAYPVRELMGTALAMRKQEKKLEAADALGKCLEYCLQLADLGRTPEERKGKTAWAHLTTRMTARIGELNGSLWKHENEALRSAMSDIWALAVSSALDTLNP